MNLSPLYNPPQIVTAALKALINMADAALLASPSSPLNVLAIADVLFTQTHIESLTAMLAGNQTNYHSRVQSDLATGLVCRICKEEKHRQALTNGGVLDLLSLKLASFAVRDGYVVPGAEAVALADGLSDVFPEPAVAGANIGQVLEAIAAVLGDSKYRAARFVNSPAILAVFPPIRAEQFSLTPVTDPRDSDFVAAGLSRPRWLTAMEYILPAVPVVNSRNSSTSHSPHSTPNRSGTHTPNRTLAGKSVLGSSTEAPKADIRVTSAAHPTKDVESPTIPWLVHLVRSLGDYERLMAASVLASLFRAGLGTMLLRETSLGLLVVPVLVGLIAKYGTEGAEPANSTVKLQRLVLEKAPAILARLVTDCDYLQKSAMECDGAKVLTRLLKSAYQPVTITDKPQYWSPNADTGMDVDSSSPLLAQLGDGGQNQQLCHQIRVRESTLKAIGSLSSSKEEYRKAFIAEDFVPYVVESLAEFPGKPKPAQDRSKEKPTVEPPAAIPTPGYGSNPLTVIVAACYVVRMLSRSVNILRTALVDYAIAMPVFGFMRHPDINVQIAATATIINLVVEVSPVREVCIYVTTGSKYKLTWPQVLTASGLMKVLCEHAHSDNPELRLNSLWALKHFVDAVGPDLKKACLEQLEPGWLVQLINDDDDDDNDLYAADTLIADDLDEDMEASQSESPLRWLYAANGCVRELDGSQLTKLRQLEDYFAGVREAENNPAGRARNDDLAIQEQGLDFIRNFIGRPMAGESTDVIDYLFSTIGQDRLFDILASKLRSKALQPFGRRTPTAGREARVLHPRPRVMIAVIFILVHIAASVPRHRQLVIAQKELLKLVALQCSSKDRDVRCAICHLIINLTWLDEDGEIQACSQRAVDLKNMGFQIKMDMLMNHDRDLDVRERAKTAMYQLEKVIS